MANVLRGDLVDGNTNVNVSAGGFRGMRTGEKRRGGAGVITVTVAEGIAIVLRQTREH
jgi:hypothetical protein